MYSFINFEAICAPADKDFSEKNRRELSGCGGLARLTGLEPVAYCLEGSCSIQLS